MKKQLAWSIMLSVSMFIASSLTAQTSAINTRPPDSAIIEKGKDMAVNVFKSLREGKSEAIADWIVEQVGYNWDASTKVQKKGEFKSKLDILLLEPPASPYGSIDSYDLIDESYLPGSNRYFRLIYISYHVGAPLVWEYRYYVKPGGELSLHSIGWNEGNPFDYLSTPDKLLTLWYAH